MIFKIALRTAVLHWRHTAGALLGIAAVVMGLTLFRGYINNLDAFYQNSYGSRFMYGDLVIDRDGDFKDLFTDLWRASFSKEEQVAVEAFLAGRPGEVKTVLRLLPIQGTIRTPENELNLFATSYEVRPGAEIRRRYRFNVLAGRPLSGAPGEIVIGSQLARNLHCEFKTGLDYLLPMGRYREEVRPFRCKYPEVQVNSTTEAGQANTHKFRIVGITDALFREIDNRYAAFSLEDGKVLADSERVGYYTIQLADPSGREAFKRDFQAHMKAKGVSLSINHWSEHKTGLLYVQTMKFFLFLGLLIRVVLYVISLLSISTIFHKIVHDRVAEIALYRFLGFEKRLIHRIFVTEGFIVGVAGSLLGVAGSLLVERAADSFKVFYKGGLLNEPIQFGIQLDFSLLATNFLLAVAISTLGVYLPIYRLTKKDSAEILHAAH